MLERRNDTKLLICNLFGAAQKYCWAQELLPQPQSQLAIFNSNRRRRPFRFWHESETVKTCTKWRCSTNFYWPPILLQFSSKNFNDVCIFSVQFLCSHFTPCGEGRIWKKVQKKFLPLQNWTASSFLSIIVLIIIIIIATFISNLHSRESEKQPSD